MTWLPCMSVLKETPTPTRPSKGCGAPGGSCLRSTSDLAAARAGREDRQKIVEWCLPRGINPACVKRSPIQGSRPRQEPTRR